MNEEFEYGEWVGVRDDESHVWVLRQYIDTVEFGDTGIKAHCIFLDDENPDNHSGHGRCYRQIRKIQKPEPELIDIEQPESIEERLDKFEAILNGAIAHINAQINSIKKQRK